jgi:FkbM family methyltransferase
MGQQLLALLSRMGIGIGTFRPVLSFSQEGEDLVLQRIFAARRDGFFVDVGAHHPVRFSNTHRFYRQGWRGINVEPNPAAMPLFARLRKRDVTLNLAISEAPGKRDYYAFAEGALNTLDRDTAQRQIDIGHALASVMPINVLPLRAVLETHLPADQAIDFLTIDAEGHDLVILKSNDWSRFRPQIVLTELYQEDLARALTSELVTYMTSQDYIPFARTVNSIFFRRAKS